MIREPRRERNYSRQSPRIFRTKRGLVLIFILIILKCHPKFDGCKVWETCYMPRNPICTTILSTGLRYVICKSVSFLSNYIKMDLMSSTTNKIAFITGASAGIGAACAEVFAREGYHLLLAARRLDRIEALAKRLQAAYQIDTHSLTLDVRGAEAVFTSFDNLPPAWKKSDVLINNAGLSQGLDPIHEGDIGDWDRMIDTNIKGLLYVTRAVSPVMASRRSGHIINIGSIAGKEVYPNGNVYCATKFAVDALTKGMRIDLLDKGIKVTAIHPGMVETEFSEVR